MTTYTNQNFASKAALKRALAEGDEIGIHEAGMGREIENGKAYLSGPHYPRAHTWYAEATIVNGLVTKVK